MPSVSSRTTIPILFIGLQGLLGDALKTIVESDPRYRVVGQTTCPHEAVPRLSTVHPSIVMADLDQADGLNRPLLEQVMPFAAKIPLLIVTHHTNPTLVNQLLTLQPQALLTKAMSRAELLPILKLLENGGGTKNLVIQLV